MCVWMTIYIYIYILESVYLDSKLLFKQVLLETMEHCLFIIFDLIFFHDSLLFF